MVAMQPQKRPGGGAGGAVTLEDLKEDLAGTFKSARAGVKSAVRQAKRQVGEATQAVSDLLKQEAEQLYDRKKNLAVAKVSRAGKVARQVAHAMHAVNADAVADYIDDAAERAEGVSDYIKARDLPRMLKDAEGVVQEYRAFAAGGLLLAGFVLGRFVKASAARQGRTSAGAEDAKSSRTNEHRRLFAKQT
jgi:hypothetical protein